MLYRKEKIIMKKIIKPIIMIILIIFIILCIRFVVLNQAKTSITPDEFSQTMQDKGFSIVDLTNDYESYNYVDQTFVAINENFQMEYYSLKDDASAKEFYNTLKENFKSSEEQSASEKNQNYTYYSKYTLSSDGKYKKISRINNTIITIDIVPDYKDEVTAILDELGY